MIKINLIQRKETKAVRRLEGRLPAEVIKKLLIPVGITMVVLIAVLAYCEFTKSDLQMEIERQKNTIEGLQKKIAEVKKFEAINKDIESKTKLIENLKKMQSVPVNILSIVAKKLPDGIWLSGLSYDDTVTVEGFGFSNLNVVAFVENLKATPELQDVHLVESLHAEYEKQSVYKFIIKFKLRA